MLAHCGREERWAHEVTRSPTQSLLGLRTVVGPASAANRLPSATSQRAGLDALIPRAAFTLVSGIALFINTDS